MFTCVPTASVHVLGWAQLDSHHSSGGCPGGETEQTDSYSCSSWERAVASKLSLCLTSNGTQLWASSHGLRRVTHSQMRTLGRCCRRYTQVSTLMCSCLPVRFTAATRCLTTGAARGGRWCPGRLQKPFNTVGGFACFVFYTCSFIVFSFCLCCSAMWRESNPTDRHYSVPRLSWALPKQPELRMEDHRARRNGNPGRLF